MSKDELVKCVQDAIELLENYRAYGPMVEEGIAAFKRINECVIEPTTEATEEAKSLIARALTAPLAVRQPENLLIS